MTQRAVKERLVDAYIADIKYGTDRAEELFKAVCTMYVYGVIDRNFFVAINNFYYDKLEEEVRTQRPDLFVTLQAKGKIRKAV